MKKAVIFVLLGIIIALLIIYNNHLLFYFQAARLRKHVSKQAAVYHAVMPLQKDVFCNTAPYSKVWAHRVNSLERFIFLSGHFQGFEMDIVFDKQRQMLEVRHPPARGNGLSFESYLQRPESKDKFFWLDVKNLTNDNAHLVSSCLSKLDDRYAIRKRIIVESNNILQLSKISGTGYFTSYYYDTESYKAFIRSGNQHYTDSVLRRVDAVSQDVLIYDTLLQLFPTKPRLTWALSIKNYLSDSLFNRLDNDTNLLVYLVNVKSPQYR